MRTAQNKTIRTAVTCFLAAMLSIGAFAQEARFDFHDELFGPPATLSVQVASFDPSSGKVTVNGNDSRAPTTPFTWNWGDETTSEGYFPQSHTYANRSLNREIKVTAHYANGGSSGTQVVVLFVAPAMNRVSLPEETSVEIPKRPVSLGAHAFSPPTGLSAFGDSAFPIVPRTTFEYVLSIAATLQMEYANRDVYMPGGQFRQVVLRHPKDGGMYSLWSTTPVSFSASDSAFGANLGEFSSFFHEMGHNVSLNAPARHFYGGKIDGNANTIYSETMAQLFQHATAYDLLNQAEHYGLDPSLTAAIRCSARASMRIVRIEYERYRETGMPFATWNNPLTPEDETLGTFMTLAYVFCRNAEISGDGYAAPLKRMMELLQTFDTELEQRYDREHDTPDASAFRATLMVAAMSHGFGQDMRARFRSLKFAVDDGVYSDLMRRVAPKSVCKSP